MKKIVSILVAVLMVAVLFAGCSSTATTSSAPASSAAASEASAAPAESGSAESVASASAASGKPTIGVIFYSKTDSLGASVYSLVNQAAETMGVDVNWQVGALDNDTQLSQVQNLISAGVQGIMMIPLADSVSQKAAQACEEAGVKLAFCFRNIGDETIKTEVTGYSTFVGMTSEDEVGAGAQLVKYLTDAGRKNLGVGFLPPGSSMNDARTAGMKQGIVENGATKLAEFTIDASGDPNKTAAGVQNFLTAFPNMDGIVMGSGSVGQGEAIAKLLSTTQQDITFTTFDTFEGMSDCFNEGTLAAAAGGMAPDALYTFMLLYNAIAGTPLATTVTELSQPYIFVTNAEDTAVYSEYIGDATKILDVFTPDYIKTLSKANNSALDAGGLQAMMLGYNIDWVKGQIG